MACQAASEQQDSLLEVSAVHLASAAQLVAKLLPESAHLGHQAASEPQDILMEVGAVHLASADNFMAHPPTTMAMVSLAFGATPVSEDSAMAMATARDTEEDTA